MSGNTNGRRLALAIGIVLAAALATGAALAEEQAEQGGAAAASSGEAGATAAGVGAPEGGAGIDGGAGIGGVEGGWTVDAVGAAGEGGSFSGFGGMGGMGNFEAGGGGGVPAVTTLDEAIDLATRLNPKVLLAQAKVAEAQALLSQTQLAVAADVAQLFQSRETLVQDHELQRQALDEKLSAARAEAERAKQRSTHGTVLPDVWQKAQNEVRVLELEGRRLAVAHQRELERIESSLMQLIGSRPRFIRATGELGTAGGMNAAHGRSASQGGTRAGGGSLAGQAQAAPQGESIGGEETGALADAPGGAASTGEEASAKTGSAGSGGYRQWHHNLGAALGAAAGAGRLGTTGAGSMSGMGTGTGGGLGIVMSGGAGPAAGMPAGRPAIPEHQQHLQVALDRATTLDVQGQPLTDLVALLKSQFEIEIQIGPGIASDQPITISVDHVKLKDLLLLLTDLYPDLCFVVRDYGLLITTRERGMQLYGPAIPADLPLRVAPPAQ